MKNVTIYSTPTCGHCHTAKQYLQENNINYTEYNVAEDPERRQEMIQISGQMGVPVILVDKELVVGFDQSRLASLLDLE